MTKRQIFLPGVGGGQCPPTFLVVDNVAEKDDLSLSWSLEDFSGSEDNTNLSFIQQEFAGSSDDFQIAFDPLRDVHGVSDDFQIAFDPLEDTFGSSDFNNLSFINPDILGLKEELVVVGLGTPQYLSVETKAGDAVGTQNVTFNTPSNVTNGDLLLVHIGVISLGALTNPIPSGWELIRNGSVGAGTILTSRVLFKKITSLEQETYVFAGLGGNNYVAEMYHIRAAHETEPINTSALSTLTAAALDSDPDGPSVTTTVSNCLVFSFLLHDHVSLPQTHTPASDHIERCDFERNSGSVIISAHCQTKIQASAGATGTVVHDCTEAVATNAVMIRVAVRPGNLSISV